MAARTLGPKPLKFQALSADRSCMTERASISTDRPADPDPAAVEHFMGTVHQAVLLRMAAGAHVGDAMLTGYSMMEAWIRVHVDGQYPDEK